MTTISLHYNALDVTGSSEHSYWAKRQAVSLCTAEAEAQPVFKVALVVHSHSCSMIFLC